MQSRLLWMIALLALGSVAGGTAPASAKVAAVQGARLTEPTGGFSYQPPAGWRIKVFPGLKYKISYTLPAGGFAPNINVVDETAAVPLDRYMQMSLAPMQRAYTKLHVISQGEFVTASGLHGKRMVINGTVGGRNVHQIFYVFAAPSNRKIIVTASWLATDGDKYTSATDGALKTFRLS